MQTEFKLSFIGGGNMATALIGGLGSQPGVVAQIHVVDPNAEALRALERRFAVTTAPRIDAAVASSDVILLAVKPQQMKQVAGELAPMLSHQLVISIAAGIRSGDLSRWLNNHAAIVRCMPNTPALIAQGVTGMFATAAVSQAQRAMADAILFAVGTNVWLDDEALIDVVTAVSGSGPAYVFYFIEAMQQAGQEMGLSATQARTLAQATFTGASQLAAQSTDSVELLRLRVTSTGGTTHAALTSMEVRDVKGAIIAAMQAAALRSKALGEEFGA